MLISRLKFKFGFYLSAGVFAGDGVRDTGFAAGLVGGGSKSFCVISYLLNKLCLLFCLHHLRTFFEFFKNAIF